MIAAPSKHYPFEVHNFNTVMNKMPLSICILILKFAFYHTVLAGSLLERKQTDGK